MAILLLLNRSAGGADESGPGDGGYAAEEDRGGESVQVIGKPDIMITKLPDKQVQVEIKGLDIYDPTTGVIHSSSMDDIACWFIDSAYNEESFFVRQAYFTGAVKSYEKVQKALRAEINDAA